MNMKSQKFRLSKLYKKWYVLAAAALLLTFLVFIFSLSDFVKETELKLLDYRFRLDPVPEKADTNVVIVAIDDFSLDFFSKNGISWPWPRSFYGYAVDYFTLAGAKAVIFDVLFYEPDIDREETFSYETDGDFADAIDRNGRIYLGTQLLLDSTYIHPKVEISEIKLTGKYTFQEEYRGLRYPIEPFIKATKSIGVLNSSPDRDGVIRRVSVLNKLNDKILSQMALKVWLDQVAKQDSVFAKGRKLFVNDQSIPLDRNGRYLLNWYGRTPEKLPFKAYPFRAVIASASAVLSGYDPILSPDIFKDKYIIIGATAAGLYDLKTNPYSKILPGMEIWATALSNYLNSEFIKVVPGWINFLITWFTTFITLFLIANFNPKKANLLLLGILVVLILSNFFVWKIDRILFNFIIPTLGFVIAYLLINTISYLLEGKSKREIRKIFTRYLHEDVIHQLEENPDLIQLGGEEVYATVLYTDIANFTTISENKEASELVKHLNAYFEKLVEYVFEYNGLLDKYMGDGIMALFGAPISRKDHALLACRATNAHRIYRDELRKKDELNLIEQFHLGTRTGINSGSFVAGNIGGERRMDYTAIGDTVNTASRLEGVNKVFQTSIIISESTYDLVKEEFLCRELDLLTLKGKNKPSKIYELVCSWNELSSQQIPEWIKMYEEALNLYREADWQKAGSIFEQLAKAPVSDNASGVLLTRCKYLMEFPPKDWDGILKLEVK
jgi:adenylate cyclase